MQFLYFCGTETTSHLQHEANPMYQSRWRVNSGQSCHEGHASTVGLVLCSCCEHSMLHSWLLLSGTSLLTIFNEAFLISSFQHHLFLTIFNGNTVNAQAIHTVVLKTFKITCSSTNAILQERRYIIYEFTV